MTIAEREKSEKNQKLKFTILGRHVVTYVRICVFEADFGRFPGHQTSSRGLF